MQPRPVQLAETISRSDYMSSAEALVVLGVKPQTLYSYVSRGLVRRLSIDGKSCLYHREDIRRLKARSAARSGHGPVAGGALHWGEPVLLTGITEVTAGGPRYRCHLATELARSGASFETVAEYLWTGADAGPDTHWAFPSSLARIAPQVSALASAYPRLKLRQLLTEILLLLGIEHSQSQDDPQMIALVDARTLIQAMCMAFGFIGSRHAFVEPRKNESIAGYLLRAFGIETTAARVRVLNAVLVLLADHEFSPATFAARIAASSGVDLHSCVGAALHVHFGSALALRCDRIELALDAPAPENAPAAEMPVPPLGFRHPLYTDGDPRARLIVELAFTLPDRKDLLEHVLLTLRRIDNHGGAVSLDSALVAVCRALGFSGLVAGGILAVSRCAGWIAHVFEQSQQDFMIRPRGKFSPDRSGAGQSAA